MATRRHTFPPATFTPVRRRRSLLRRQASRRNIFEQQDSMETADASQSSPALICTNYNSDDETVLHSNLVPLNDVHSDKNTANAYHNSFSSTDCSISDLSTLIAVEGQRSKSKDMDDLSKSLDILEISFRTSSKTNIGSSYRLSTSEVEMFLDGSGADMPVPKHGRLSRSSRKNSRAARTA